MKSLNRTLMVGALLLLGLSPLTARGQTDDDGIRTRNMGGPRFGMTYVPGNDQLATELEYHGMGRTISQFGWHFEHQVVPAGGGPRFLIEFVPMLAGVEYSKVIPNFTLAMGLRSPGGWEFGLGPNLVFSKTTTDEVEARTALLLAVGKSFNYGGVSIPVNLAYATSPTGKRISVIFGYAMGSKKKKAAPQITENLTELPPNSEWATPHRP